MKKDEIKHIPKNEVPEAKTITVEIPTRTDARDGIRQEIAYLQMLMRRYPGPTERFYNESKST